MTWWGWLGAFRKEERLTDSKNQPRCQLCCGEPAWDGVLHTQSCPFVSHHLRSQPHSSRPCASQGELLTILESCCQGPCPWLPRCLLSHSAKGGPGAPALNSHGALQRAVNLVLIWWNRQKMSGFCGILGTGLPSGSAFLQYNYQLICLFKQISYIID